MGPSLVWFPNRSKIWALLGLSAFLWPLCPWPVRRPFSTRPLLLPSAPSPPAPFLPPSAVSSREISASDFEKRRWRIPSLSLLSPYWPSFRLLSVKSGHPLASASFGNHNTSTSSNFVTGRSPFTDESP